MVYYIINITNIINIINTINMANGCPLCLWYIVISIVEDNGFMVMLCIIIKSELYVVIIPIL